MSTREAVGTRDGGRFATAAVKANGLVFTTGNIGPDPDTGELPPDVESQTRNTLARLQRVLEQAGSELAKVIKVNVYLDDIAGEFDRMNAAYDAFFREHGITEPPARTTVGARLPWAKVEIDMVAAG
jgi:2-iminobutanoate/2-iminopropanoate deaminase